MSRQATRATLRRNLIAASVAACFSLSGQQAGANPTGGTVVSGSAAFATAGSTLTVTNSANTIINWQGFSIGINEITRFLQSSAGSAVLNRVVGANGAIPQSVIDGVLSSNGRVFLLNPMGVVIGPGARIDVAGLVASSLNLSNEDFLAGRMRFTEVPGAGGIANHGTIETTASGGRVFLVAPSVENTGIIKAPQGDIVLAAGKSAELVSEASPFVTVRITADAEQALNVGSLIADSGRIGMYGAIVRNAGIAAANGAVAGPGGQIRFVATRDLTLDAGSRTSASGTSGGDVLLQAEGGINLIAGTVEARGSAGKGGTVSALGVRVGVVGHGVIDASGESGGGTVLVGGDYQGKNASGQNAQRSFIGPDGVIRADAGTTGDGGRVIVWADGDTGFYGNISARGGAQSGNGGFVETSGKRSLQVLGRVDTGAPNGQAGAWLLDPTDINVISTAGADDFYIASVGNVDGSASSISFVSAGAIQDYTGDVSLNASNDVNFLADISKSNGGLSVNAGNDINLNSSLISVAGPVDMSAGNSITSTLDPTLTQIRTNGGSVFMQASAGSLTVGGIDTTGGVNPGSTDVSLYANGNITAGHISTGDTSDGDTSIYISSSSGSVTTGNLTTGNAFDGCGDACDSYSDVDIYAGNGMITTGSITAGSSAFGGYSYVYLYSSNGGVEVKGPIRVGAAADGGEGNVNIYAYSGAATIHGGISTAGGSDTQYTDVNVYTGAGGGSITVMGDVQTGSSAYDSSVYMYSDGNLSTGAIRTGTANEYSYVDLYAWNGGVQTGAISTGEACSMCNDGYYRHVGIWSGPGDILVKGPINTRGVNPGFSGGRVTLRTDTGRIVVDGSIDARGADGIAGDMTYYGGSPGGDVRIGRSGAAAPAGGNAVEVRGAILTSAGHSYTDPTYGSPSSGKDGGDVCIGLDGCESSGVNILQGSIAVGGPIITRGGRGGDAGSGSGWNGEDGGSGGGVTLLATDSITVGAPAQTGVMATVIDTSGGNGGTGDGSGIGGMGGNAGEILVDPTAILFNGSVIGIGGAGNGNLGGDGASLQLLTTDGTGTITFINGGYDVTGGLGSPPGASGIVTAQGTLILVTLVAPEPPAVAQTPFSDPVVAQTPQTPFSDPSVAQSIGSTIHEMIAAASSDETSSTEEQDRKKKAGQSSCRP